MPATPNMTITTVDHLEPNELSELCSATEAVILDNVLGFNVGIHRTEPLIRERLESYWKGVLLVPERVLMIGQLDGVIAASIELVKPVASNQTSAFVGLVEQHFVAPWARGHGLAKALLQHLEGEAKAASLSLLRLSVRANLTSAIGLYESLGYHCWGTLPKYEYVDGRYLEGRFYYKELMGV